MGQDYLDNDFFESLIVKFQESEEKKDKDKASYDEYVDYKRQLGECLYILSEQIIKAYRFKLIEPEDALQEGVMICFAKIGKFKKERGKAFNYMTTVTLNHFRQLYRSAFSYNEFKKKFAEAQYQRVKDKFYSKLSKRYRQYFSDSDSE